MKKTLIAALLAASLPAFAGQYYVVVPVPNRTPTTGNILVSLNPFALPAGLAGRAYASFDFNSVLQVQGDPNFSANYLTWYVTGGTLPAGMTLSSTGKLTGTPTQAGNSSFQVMASYKTKTGQQAYQVVVGEVTVGLASASLPQAVQGASYFYDLKPLVAVTGDPTFTAQKLAWAIAGGSLPAGLQLNTDGTITGVATAEGSGTITAQARYLTGVGSQTYQVVVGAISVSLGAIAAPAGVVGVPYGGVDLKPSVSIAGDGAYAGAAAGVTWSLSSGTLPAGLVLNPSTGIISGTPTARSSGGLQARADYKSKSATQAMSISLSDSVKQYAGYRAWSDGTYARSCNAYRTGAVGYVYQVATGDGIYRIDIDGAGPMAPVDVVCDMTTDGGGWTVIQNRYNGALDFYRTYAEYASGFGVASAEYWLGNDRIAALTAGGTTSLRVDLSRTNGDKAYEVYSTFKINGAADKYRLSVSGPSGTAGDSLTYGNNMMFSTYDADNDTYSSSCSVEFRGAWWYASCHQANLNGAYLNGPHASFADGMEWFTLAGHYESMKTSVMKVR